MTEPTSKRSEQYCCPIVELRQYTLHPGKRDAFIDLFDRQFIETQEAVGVRVIGQFRDVDDPNRFVWLRGFRDMPSGAQRGKCLRLLYALSRSRGVRALPRQAFSISGMERQNFERIDTAPQESARSIETIADSTLAASSLRHLETNY